MGPLDQRLTLIASMAQVRPTVVYWLWKMMESAPASFDPEAAAKFAHIEIKYVTAIVSALSDQNMLPVAPEPPAKPVRAAKGTRLAPDFVMPADWLRDACARRYWTQADAADEAEQFIAYWHGNGQTKADWKATWRNWYLRSKRPDGLKVSHSSNTPMSESWSDWAEKTAALYDKMGRTNEAAQLRARINV